MTDRYEYHTNTECFIYFLCDGMSMSKNICSCCSIYSLFLCGVNLCRVFSSFLSMAQIYVPGVLVHTTPVVCLLFHRPQVHIHFLPIWFGVSIFFFFYFEIFSLQFFLFNFDSVSVLTTFTNKLVEMNCRYLFSRIIKA